MNTYSTVIKKKQRYIHKIGMEEYVRRDRNLRKELVIMYYSLASDKCIRAFHTSYISDIFSSGHNFNRFLINLVKYRSKEVAPISRLFIYRKILNRYKIYIKHNKG